jgi:hypothetical protein
VQRTGQFSKPIRRIAAGTISFLAVLLLLALATVAQADEPPASAKSFITAVQECPKLELREQRDLLLFFQENLNLHNRSNSWFAVRADFREFGCYEGFTRRESPYVAGIKASFTF